ncbi:MAG: GC-type dockerin domain-anchored protein [Phycisphaerales bacterium]
MQDLGTLGGTGSGASGVSADGSVVVGGSSNAAGQSRAFRWTVATGMQNLGTLGGYSDARGVSADGSVVVGTSGNATGRHRAFRWTVATGMQDLGTLGGTDSEAYGVSADGLVVVGGSSNAAGQSRTFRWTAATGMQDLGTLGGYSDAYGVSADGSVVVGTSSNAAGQPRAFRWTAAGGMQDLGTLGGTDSEARGVSADGSVVVGDSGNAAGQYHAFRWTTAEGMHDLGTLGGTYSAAYGVSADESAVVGSSSNAAGQYRAFRWSVAELLFRESDDASWTFGPDGIPGWDHVGLFANCRVYESHPGYGNHSFWDPDQTMFVTVTQDNGVQWQHTRGSFRHDSTTMSSTAANLSVSIPAETASAMAAFIETQGSAPFWRICESSLDLSCLRDRLQPERQKGRIGGAYTCVGLVERAAEEAGLNGGQGFIPNIHESFHVHSFGDVPCLSPEVLSWFAQRGFHFADDGALCGLFDPVDFVLIDPAGRRLGHTEALGTLNEISDALYTGSGTIEQFFIPNPMPGAYQLQLVGTGSAAGAAVGGMIEGQIFEGVLAAGETHDMNFTVSAPCPADLAEPFGQLDFSDVFAFLIAFGAMDPTADLAPPLDVYDFSDVFAFLVAFAADCP